tara:strand:- start:499 stop:1275 length:777 start_codon:yes stop_codon:yes gene_type:complete
MAVTFNYTKRKKIESGRMCSLIKAEKGDIKFSLDLDLSPYSFPPDARVYVEAYRKSFIERFDMGPVSELRKQEYSLNSRYFGNEERVNFRIKVTENIKQQEGRILGAGKSTARKNLPKQEPEDEVRILPVEIDDLGDEIFKVDFPNDEEVVLYMNEKLDNPKGHLSDPQFVSVVFPTILRTVLHKIIFFERYVEADESLENWKDQWLNFAEPFSGTKPYVDPEADTMAWKEWIDSIISNFASDQKYLTLFKSHINEDN